MGTNYYWHEGKPCPSCGRCSEPSHIGKSSCGWAFSLHVNHTVSTAAGDVSVTSLDDWIRLFMQSNAYICDEYGDHVTPAAMISTITERSWRGGPPNRHDVDGRFCIGQGDGTFDLLVGEFR